MVICEWCKQSMTDSDGCLEGICIGWPSYYLSYIYMQLPPTHFSEPYGRCHDCHAKHGMPHHCGCDVQRCPKCGGQFISCDCNKKVFIPFGVEEDRTEELNAVEGFAKLSS